MKAIHAIPLGLALAVLGSPDAAAQAGPHDHAQAAPAPAEPAAQAAPAAHAGRPAADKPMGGMSCDPEMHEMMMKRMERMEAMMEMMQKMQGAPTPDANAATNPAEAAEEHEHK
jgi:hypothetical protein